MTAIPTFPHKASDSPRALVTEVAVDYRLAELRPPFLWVRTSSEPKLIARRELLGPACASIIPVAEAGEGRTARLEELIVRSGRGTLPRPQPPSGQGSRERPSRPRRVFEDPLATSLAQRGERAVEDLAASGGGDARDPLTLKLERPRNPPPASASLENCGVVVAEIAQNRGPGPRSRRLPTNQGFSGTRHPATSREAAKDGPHGARRLARCATGNLPE